ncbi:hypothetical protein ACI1MP_00140 [Kitasatospora griseola]|uniref:hypothetical protein n=1 Tax=Kitasatospora griseola TaxID=2064 RepID=UPI003855D66F
MRGRAAAAQGHGPAAEVLVDRVEHGLPGGDGWVAVHDGFFLGDPVTEHAALHTTPELAARIIHHAHVHDLRAVRDA